jgi:MFS family permease
MLTRSPLIIRPPRKVIFVGIAIAFSLLGDQAMYAILPIYFRDIGLVPIHVGLILSANRWIRLLTNTIAEKAIARYNPTTLLMAVLLLGAVITLTYSACSLFLILLFARMVWGLCWSFLRQIGMMTAIESAPEKNTAQVMGYFHGLVRIGSVCGLLFGGVLFDLVGYNSTFLILGVVSLMGSPLGGISQKGISPVNRVDDRHKVQNKESGPINGLLGCGFIQGCVGPGLITATLGAILEDKIGASISLGTFLIGVATLNGALLGARWILESLCAPILGALNDRFGTQLGMLVFFGIGAVSLFTCGAISNILALIIFILFYFISGTSLAAGIASEAGRRGSRTIALYASALDLGAAIGPVLSWVILGFIYIPELVFEIAGFFYLIAAVISWRSFQRNR